MLKPSAHMVVYACRGGGLPFGIVPPTLYRTLGIHSTGVTMADRDVGKRAFGWSGLTPAVVAPTPDSWSSVMPHVCRLLAEMDVNTQLQWRFGRNHYFPSTMQRHRW